ncbi:MAG: hypothetical protein PHE83_05675 [Opitutaceae bacterium]|nr:hypothetical protein [Opitutaceae bacterium]
MTSDARPWWETNQNPEDRLLKFDRWLAGKLSERLLWPADRKQAARLVQQCRIELEHLVLDLWRRGWMLDGLRLAKHIEAALDAVGKAQLQGRVLDFWPFFRRVVGHYVGVNSEEIRAEALSAGAHVSQIMAGIKRHAPALPELIALRRDETLREKLARRRKSEARQQAGKAQLPLF